MPTTGEAAIEDSLPHTPHGEHTRSFAARLFEIFIVATRLGLTSFGGPVAHLGYFRDEYVARRKWIGEQAYADVVALCQFLPGPASSQVGMAIGIKRAGWLGGLAAWLGFTWPSAIAMIAFAYGVSAVGDLSNAGWLHGLKIVAVAVVALAVWGMAKGLCPDRPRITIALLAAVLLLFAGGPLAQIGVIVAGGLVGRLLFRPELAAVPTGTVPGVRRHAIAIVFLVVFFALLTALPVLRQTSGSEPLAVFDSFYRAGSLVFGGGHVVLPILHGEVVPKGWVTNDEFIAGYGAAQALPGPLMTFAGYLGASMDTLSPRWLGGLIALLAIFLPSYLLVAGVLPFWDKLRATSGFRRALMGINAAVVGLLIAALYDPVWTSAIRSPEDFALGLAAFGLLAFWKWPPWIVVALTAAGGVLLAL